MKQVVLSIVRIDNNVNVAIYAGVVSNKHIYAKQLTVSTDEYSWPVYIRIKRSLTDPIYDENGKGTSMRKWLVESNKPMEFSKNFRELERCNLKDIEYIREVNKALKTKFYDEIDISLKFIRYS